MKNKEKFLDKILETLVHDDIKFAVKKDTHEPCLCDDISTCDKCLFNKRKDCILSWCKWLSEEEYNKWENVKIDTKILVRHNKRDSWKYRHFHKYENGEVYAYVDGKTSFTTIGEDCTTVSIPWAEAKLYDEESDEL